MTKSERARLKALAEAAMPEAVCLVPRDILSLLAEVEWLEDENDELKCKLASLEAELAQQDSVFYKAQQSADSEELELNDRIDELTQNNAKLKRKLAAAVEALRKHGAHFPCSRNLSQNQPGTCDCGLEAAIAAASEEEP